MRVSLLRGAATGALSVSLGVALLVAPAGAPTTTPKQPPSSVGAATETALAPRVATARFENQDGTLETLRGLKGKTVLIVPFLTLCSDTCPFTTGNLLQLQSKLDADGVKNVEVVAISVDPYRDTLARIRAYAKLIGANFQVWTELGPTTTPVLTKKDLAEKSPVGSGDINANLLTLEKFFGWSVQVVAQGEPPSTDWMAPHETLTYDINHSDGFWIVDSAQRVRFASGDLPAFTGTLARVLATFMDYKSNIYDDPVYKGGWTPLEALQALEWVVGSAF